MSNPIPERRNWRLAYQVALFSLAGIELAAVVIALFTGDWSYTLTHQTKHLVWEHWWLGVPIILFLAWLLYHFAVRVWKVWKGKLAAYWRNHGGKSHD